MGQSSSRQYSYQQYYTAMQKSGNINIQNIDFDNLDPYEVLNVSKKFTWDELKESYRKMALITHPDKQGGNEIIFNYVTECFKKLAIIYKNRDADKPHDVLKEQSKNFFQNQINNTMPHPSEIFGNTRDESEPFHKKFNKNFETCKIQDENIDFGYSSMMDKSTDKRDDISIKNIFKNNKVDSGTFNEIFNKSVPVSKEITKYKEPEALQLVKNMQYTELGGQKTDDYSSSIEQKSNLAYTDYMKAYSGQRLVNENDIKNRKEFKNIEQYEKYRDTKMKKTLSEKERNQIELLKNIEEKKEFERLERLKLKDIEIQKMHEKASRLFLK